jgi:hypothetical protein
MSFRGDQHNLKKRNIGIIIVATSIGYEEECGKTLLYLIKLSPINSINRSMKINRSAV